MIPNKTDKSNVGELVVFLGIEGAAPSPANSMKLSARLTPEKSAKRVDDLKLSLRQGREGHKDLESAICRLGFAQTCLFGKFARCQIRPLYVRLLRKWYIRTLSDYEVSARRRRAPALHNVSPRVVISPPPELTGLSTPMRIQNPS